MKKFFITSSVGFIGSYLSEFLLNRGDLVYGIDNFDELYSKEFKENNLAILNKIPNFKFHNIDITNFKSLKKMDNDKANLDGIFHIPGSADVKGNLKEPTKYVKTNILGMFNIYEWIKGYKNVSIVAASSSSVYGKNAVGSFNEYSSEISFPISQYAASKKSIEFFSYIYYSLYGLSITLMRFFTGYGARGRHDMALLRLFIRILNEIPIKLFGDEEVKRDFTYISDIIKGILLPFSNSNGYNIYNIGNSYSYTINDLISKIENCLDKKAKIIYENSALGDIPITYADITNSIMNLNFESNFKLEKGIMLIKDWYDSLDDNYRKILINEEINSK